MQQEDTICCGGQILTALRGNSARTLAITNVMNSFGFRWLRCQSHEYLSFNIYVEIYKEKQDQKRLVPIHKLMCLNFSSITKILRLFRLRLSLERSFKHFRCFQRSLEDAFLTTGGLD